MNVMLHTRQGRGSQVAQVESQDERNAKHEGREENLLNTFHAWRDPANREQITRVKSELFNLHLR